MSKKLKDKKYTTVSRTRYLKLIQTRLDTEYIKILEMVNEYNLTHKRGIGFWSLIRIIFPVIETVAYTIGKEKEDFLEQDLHVPYGHLVWELYRHALMHTDELRYGVYKRKTISWAVDLSTESSGHFIAKQSGSHPTTIHIHIPSLYYALQEFLVKEIAKKDRSPISVQNGVQFQDHLSKLINELEEVYSKY